MDNLRLLEWEDLDALIRLLHAYEAVDQTGFVPTAESLRHMLAIPGLDVERFLYVLPAGKELIAFGGAVPIPGPEGTALQVNVVVHPDHRAGGLPDDLLRFVEARAAEWRDQTQQTATLQSHVPAHLTDLISLYERHGYQPARWFLELARDLQQPIPDLPAPPGITIRAIEIPEDFQAIHFAIMDSFRDHWNPPDFSLEQLSHLMSGPKSRPELTLLALDSGGEPAGVCQANIRDEYNQQHDALEGYIGTLGVRRPFRRLGLGRALLTRSLLLLRNEGMTTAVLDVDAESPTGATRLYAAVGFTERKRSVVLQKLGC